MGIMPQLKEVFELEKSRMMNGPFNIIYLFPEGTFYRAYEWSAWLCCQYINPFKATRREVKGEMEGTVVFIGFPITSLSKYIPEEAEVKVNDDKSVAITLSRDVFKENDDPVVFRDSFSQWKEEVPLMASRKGSVKEDLRNMSDQQPRRMSEIMLRVLAFPVEQKTPMDCMNFIAEIKQEITKLL